MESTVDDVYELKTVWDYYTRKDVQKWYIKDSVKNAVKAQDLVPGDKVYLPTRNSKYGFRQCEEYLSSIGCTRAKSAEAADKILIDYGYYSVNLGPEGFVDKPNELTEVLIHRHKLIKSSDFYTKVRDYIDDLRPRFDFDFAAYENMWQMLKTGKYENIRMAAVGIMTANWVGNEFLLEFLVIHFNSEMRVGQLGSLSKWSDFANKNNLEWKSKHVYAWSITEIMKKYLISQEQMQLIHKLLNLNK